MRMAFSPCPNDTFVFHALVHGLVPGAPPVTVDFADVDVTNGAAERGEYDLVKVSYAALPWLLDKYTLLPCGGALGRGCGPLVLTTGSDSVEGKTVAVPGDRTTAYLLFRFWSAERPPARVVVRPFHEIMPAVAAGEVDAGLVIHEARFTYQRYGLHAAADLGDWWESTTGLPIPLGAILARKDLEARTGITPAAAAKLVRASVEAAWADPGASRGYVLEHAQEMEDDVVDQHIGLYVNEFTRDLGTDGYAAVDALLGRAAGAGLVPPVAIPRLTAV
ncbi:1,4-dihydroxy-6-naphthoate synthase [Cryptosporangium arvum]|uniref:1,4-dihydroxy-6-naphtoate synthase n=1 Tax=Cryptosporangium arvum DSM 44712 TaxID=927661 RepID=A0A010YWJ0_9ACTN|nr:1,4-dihydroxy-6-naphthoate synthase [Cryptosporangium arvum]EXG79518.1 putative periplasmic solute-binding protein [Cryptosporangium arvum DSM 44712]